MSALSVAMSSTHGSVGSVSVFVGGVVVLGMIAVSVGHPD